MSATANKTGRNRVRKRERRGLRDPQPWCEALGRLGDGGKHAERRRGDGLRARARQWRRLGFARTGRRLRLGLGFQGCAGVAFIGAARPPWRAGQGRCGRAGAGLGAESCSGMAGKKALTGGVRTTESERGEGRRIGPEEGSGPAGLQRRRRRKKKLGRWLGLWA